MYLYRIVRCIKVLVYGKKLKWGVVVGCRLGGIDKRVFDY